MREEKKSHVQIELLRLDRKMKRIERDQPQIPGFRISRLKYLIHLIMSHKQDDHPGAYSVLKMEYLRNIVPNAHLYMYYLEDLGIIEWKNHSQGRNSRLYRLVDEGLTVERPITDMELVNRIEATYKEIQRHNSKKYPLQNNTIRRVKINLRAARADIEAEYKILGNNSRRNYFLAQIHEIHLGHFTISVNDTNGRLDSNFTRLPSYLMKHLTLDGQPLFELDLKNSQPFIVACLFNPSPEVEEIMKDFADSYFIEQVKSRQVHKQKDIKLYTNLVCSGQFYDYMEAKFKEKGLRFRDRDHLKERIFKILYSPNEMCKRTSAAKLFRELFPNVYGMFYFIKCQKHNKLANLLTTIESHLVLDRVIPAIQERFQGLQVLTKHDAILPFEPKLYVPGQFQIESVRDLFQDTIEEYTGLRPTVKISGQKRSRPKRTAPGPVSTFRREMPPIQKSAVQ
jgi:hypothetical protein